jgi:signal-transduction protein with cAMP-binding, CBS, and nucleotidyltransferase domain
MSVGRISSRVVVTISRRETVRTAARRMAENGVGTVVVVEADGVLEACGIVTDRDIAVRCVAGHLDPDRATVATIMTSPVDSVDESMPIDEAVERMAASATRRLVVTGDRHQLVGILSLDDVLGVIAEEAQSVGRLIQRQQHGGFGTPVTGPRLA